MTDRNPWVQEAGSALYGGLATVMAHLSAPPPRIEAGVTATTEALARELRRSLREHVDKSLHSPPEGVTMHIERDGRRVTLAITRD